MKVVTCLILLLLIFTDDGVASSVELGEPALQVDESNASFFKGHGGSAKNSNSAVASGVNMGAPVVGGSGCTSGTVAASLTPDGKTMSLLFDNYVALAGESYGTNRDVKLCTLQIPIDVPAGLQFTVVKLDYRGFNSIPGPGRTRYVTLYSFVDPVTQRQLGRRVRRRYNFTGPLEENFILSSDVSTTPVWSRCGRKINLRIDTRIVAATNKKNIDVMAMMDSIDGSVGSSTTNYHILWRRCQR